MPKISMWAQEMLPPKQTVVALPGKIGLARQLPPSGILWLDEVESTHNLLKTPEYAGFPVYKMLAARNQTAGRGQRGNRWEAEPGKNLTFSLVIKPANIPPSMQFHISEATALAVVATLLEFGIAATVKWPNDIYVDDSKICGILIDHSIDSEHILRSVISAGININQLHFHSDAPNPISMARILGREIPLEDVARRFMVYLREYIPLAETAIGRAALHKAMLARLYWYDGHPHPFRNCSDGHEFMGIIERLDPDGILHVRELPSSTAQTLPPPHPFRFKEIAFLVKENRT